jgi:hypothetical protein
MSESVSKKVEFGKGGGRSWELSVAEAGGYTNMGVSEVLSANQNLLI